MHKEFADRPIPLELPSVAGWKEVPIREQKSLIQFGPFKRRDEPLVPLGPFSENDAIFTRSIYGGEGIESPYREHPLVGSLITMFVSEGVAKQLKTAQKLLPAGMYFVVFDAYRDYAVQQSLFDRYFGDLRNLHPDWQEDELLTETQKYVSLPSKDPTRPSPHNTGGAVDLAIFQLPASIDQHVKEINRELAGFNNDREWQRAYLLEMRRIALMREHAQMVDFGTPYDWGGPEAALNYFERLAEERSLTPQEEIGRGNRRLLYHVMTQVGFEPYEDEWWHYNSKRSQMGAKTAGLLYVEYGAARLSAANIKHEVMRKNHRLGSIRMLEGSHVGGKLGIISEFYMVAERAVRETGDLRISSFPEAAMISPP